MEDNNNRMYESLDDVRLEYSEPAPRCANCGRPAYDSIETEDYDFCSKPCLDEWNEYTDARAMGEDIEEVDNVF